MNEEIFFLNRYDESKTPTKVDMARIHQICKFNFTGTRCFDEKDDTFISCGVWVGSSKINNSCIDANVTCVHHDSGLVMMVTTFKAVKKGEEILTSYVDPMLSLTKERNFELSGRFWVNLRFDDHTWCEICRIFVHSLKMELCLFFNLYVSRFS